MSDPLRHHPHYKPGPDGRPKPLMGDSFMERMSEKVASGMGTVPFLLVSLTVILAWTFANHLVHFLSQSYHGLIDGRGFDPAPYILLNLVFSAVAFFTGALVIIAQKAQAKRDRVNTEGDATHREDLAQQQLTLLQANTDLTDQVHKLAEESTELTRQIHALVAQGTS